MKKIFGLFAVILIALMISVPPASVEATGGNNLFLTSTYGAGNGCAGSMFNLYFNNNVTITGLYQHIDTDAGVSPSVYVRYRYGTYNGNETNAGAWSYWTNVAVTNQGTGTGTWVELPDFYLPAGTWLGVYVHVESGSSFGVEYTTGATDYANADINIDNGVGLCGLYTSVNADRTWNGTIYYNCACVASAGSPSLTSPAHKAHITDTTPTFFWSNVSNFQSYRFMIYTEDRSFEFKQRIFTNSITPPALVPQKYLWRVRTQDNTCSTWSSWSGRFTIFID